MPVSIEVAGPGLGTVEASAHAVFGVARMHHILPHGGAPDRLSGARGQETGFLRDIFALAIDMELGDIEDQ